MKYIRTKETDYGCIIDTEKYLKEIGEECYIPQNEIVAQADSIEELCDEFVGIDSQGHFIIHNDKWLEGARIVPLEEIRYYGAIWTKWGLKYVAKVNDKGEWELL